MLMDLLWSCKFTFGHKIGRFSSNEDIWPLITDKCMQGRIHAWADRAAQPPWSKVGGWSWLWEAVGLRHGGKQSLRSLTFGPSFVLKMDGWLSMAFSFIGLCPVDPPPSALSLRPCWGFHPRHWYRLVLCDHNSSLANAGFGPEYIVVLCTRTVFCAWISHESTELCH